MDDYQILQEQDQDYQRAKAEIEDFLVKCEVGMQTVNDVQQAAKAMRLLGINVEV